MTHTHTNNGNSDLLRGASEIALFLFGDRRKRRAVYYMTEQCRLPMFRIGCMIYARKSTLAMWLSKKDGQVGPVEDDGSSGMAN